MGAQTPIEVVQQFSKGINGGNAEQALSSYESEGTLVVEPGKVAVGTQELREAIEGFIAVKSNIKIEGYEIIESGDIALFCSKWSTSGFLPDGSPFQQAGESSDVLRRQPDGNWLIALDNPYGAAIIG